MNSRRRRLTEGTEVLWSTVTYVPVIICAWIALWLSAPALAPYEAETKPTPMWFVLGLVGVCALAAPFVIRSQLVKPLKLLAREIGDEDVLRAHAKYIARCALPYVPLMAIPVALLCLTLDGLFWPQLLIIVGVDHLIDRWRNGPITKTVDDLLQRPSGWAKG